MVGPVPGGSAPAATLDGTIQSAPMDFDPYATYGTAPQPLFAQDPNLPLTTPSFMTGSTFSFATMRRLIEEVRLDYVWMPGNGDDEFGIHDAELSTTFNFPFLWNEAPLQVTPGFAVHYWNGPVSVLPTPADLPARAYDAYLDAAWEPRVTAWLRGELAFRVGVYSDFTTVNTDSLRYTGRGLLALAFSPSFSIKGGIWYLDRLRVKMLPAGGIVWTPGGPNGDVRFDILFPNPKLACRLRNIGDTDWWWYLRGEYGGGSWTVKRADFGVAVPTSGIMDEVDYNDYRAAVGLEFIRPNGFTGLFEVGFAFEREILYQSGSPESFKPKETVFLRGGLAY